MDRHTWMYKISRATQEYIDGVEKFIQCEEENLKKKREHGIHSEKTRTSDGNRGSNEDSTPTNKEDDVENDKINEMIEDVEDLLVHQPKILENLVDDSKKLLYPRCNDEFTRLSTTLKLCQLKVKSGWSDKSFTELLKLVSELFPVLGESWLFKCSRIKFMKSMPVHRSLLLYLLG
ncbi:hypothetical protein POM88_041121 [Heracleum sosnowskyi]|uniref:Uncharacterized protein n=1 Tax=Heracleum sosnowskyi TaxID=360622 RepID=A0AAD8HG51_9APIA|nr:hypothetical protein POM88_041121 [Heracleum sosnowskyi]